MNLFSPERNPSRQDHPQRLGLPRQDAGILSWTGEPGEPRLEKVNLDGFLADHEEEYRFFLGPNINLHLAFSGRGLEIDADPDELRTLISIFLSNSKNAMPYGGQLLIQTSVATLSEPSASYVMLAISDSGKGMHYETQAKLHELLLGQWKPRGGGLSGLVDAKRILDAHHAKLLFYSQTIRGTTFKCYFPIPKSVALPFSPPAVPKGNETLLFVEDDPMTRHIYTKYLRQRGYNVLEAQHGKEAMDMCEQYGGNIHLLVTDVVMPELNGRQLVDLVSLNHPELKVLYISGFAKDAIIQRGILKGDTPYLEKPFGREELALRVRQMLDN